MICIGKKEPDDEITKVKVMFLLLVIPFMGTGEELLVAIVIPGTEIQEQGIWSALINYRFRRDVMLCDGPFDIHEINKLELFKNPSDGRAVVPTRREKWHHL